MQVPAINAISHITNKCFDNIPVGILKRKNSKGIFLDLELCSFQVSDASKIKKISLWHRFSKQMGVLGTDILILEGDEIKANAELDFLGSTRCSGDKDKEEGVAYFLDSKNKAIHNVSNLLLKIHEISPSWLSKTSLCNITPKFEAFINVPSVRGLKKMQYEAQYLYTSSVKGSSFSNFLAILFKNTLQFEKCPLHKLECLAKHEIKNLKEQMSSPREGQTLELTTPCNFMDQHEERLISHIKRVAYRRIFWGCREGDFLKGDPAYKRTVAYMLRDYFEVGVIQEMAAFDL
jgi:hypothetical protein